MGGESRSAPTALASARFLLALRPRAILRRRLLHFASGAGAILVVKELSYRERAPARTVAFVPLTEADGAQKAVARLMGLLADEEGVSVLESPQHVHSELDYFAAITRGERGFGLHFDCMRLGKRGSLLILGLTELPTGPPGVGRCPPLVDDRGARAMLAIVDGCLGAMFSGDLVRWCAPGEQRALLDAYLVGAPAG